MLNLTQILTIMAITSCFTVLVLLIGYRMGRATKHDEPLYQPKFDPGASDEPEGDVIIDNLYEDEEEERVPTIRTS